MFRGSWHLALPIVVLLLAGCTQKMAQAPRYDPLEPSSFYPDGRSSREPPADTVGRGRLRDDSELFTGKSNGVDLEVFPIPITREVLDRGHERFDISCAPCHGLTGNGDGMIVQRGFSPPPSYHSDRSRLSPVGHFYDVITNGYGSMAPYASQVSVRDRWSIVAYIRALQLSQNATIDDVPQDARLRLERGS